MKRIASDIDIRTGTEMPLTSLSKEAIYFLIGYPVQFSSVQLLSHVWHCDLMDRPPCPSPTPGVHPNSCPLSQWCHPTSSSFVIPFSHLQSFPASGSFPMSQFFPSGSQRIGVSASASVLPMNTQDWSPLEMDWLDLLTVQGTLFQCRGCEFNPCWRS